MCSENDIHNFTKKIKNKLRPKLVYILMVGSLRLGLLETFCGSIPGMDNICHDSNVNFTKSNLNRDLNTVGVGGGGGQRQIFCCHALFIFLRLAILSHYHHKTQTHCGPPV